MDSLVFIISQDSLTYNPLTGWPRDERISLTSSWLFHLPYAQLWNNVPGVKITLYVFSASVSDTLFRTSISSNAFSLLSSKKYSDAGVVYLISLNVQKCLSMHTLVVWHFLTLKWHFSSSSGMTIFTSVNSRNSEVLRGSATCYFQLLSFPVILLILTDLTNNDKHILPGIIYSSTFNITRKICFSQQTNTRGLSGNKQDLSSEHMTEFRQKFHTSSFAAVKIHNDQSPKCLKSFEFQASLGQISLNSVRTKGDLTIWSIHFLFLSAAKHQMIPQAEVERQ